MVRTYDVRCDVCRAALGKKAACQQLWQAELFPETGVATDLVSFPSNLNFPGTFISTSGRITHRCMCTCLADFMTVYYSFDWSRQPRAKKKFLFLLIQFHLHVPLCPLVADRLVLVLLVKDVSYSRSHCSVYHSFLE